MDIQKQLDAIGLHFFQSEIENGFTNLKCMRLRGLRNVLDWVGEMDASTKNDFLEGLFSGERNSFYERKRLEVFCSGVAEPRYKFKDSKKLLKRFKSEYKKLDFSDFDSDSIFSEISEKKFTIRTILSASSRAENIICRSMIFLESHDHAPKKFSLLSLCKLYGYDCWKEEGLDMEASFEEVVQVMEKSYELIRQIKV